MMTTSVVFMASETASPNCAQPPKEKVSTFLLAAVQPVNVDSSPVSGQTGSSAGKLSLRDISAPELFAAGNPEISWISVDDKTPEAAKSCCSKARLPCINIVLACCAFALGIVFGVAGFILEYKARQLVCSGSVDDRKKAYRLRKASCVTSVAGIIIGTVALITALSTAAPDVDYKYNYENYETGGYPRYPNEPYHPDYYDTEMRSYGECLDGECYVYKQRRSCSTCIALGGKMSNDGFCHYNARNCPDFTIEGNCFSTRTETTREECDSFSGYFSSGQCYYTPRPYCAGIFAHCTCYLQQTKRFTEDTCKNVKGYYHMLGGSYMYTYSGYTGSFDYAQQALVFPTNKTCYYNSFNCLGYVMDGQCYTSRDTEHLLTTETCINIGGHRDPSTGYCYHNGFRCPHPQLGNQCYRTSMYVPSCSTCLNTGGVLVDQSSSEESSMLCYYYALVQQNDSSICSHFTVQTASDNGLMYACETNRSPDYSWQLCADIDGIFDNDTSTCYYTPKGCTGYQHGCKCYNYRWPSIGIPACRAYEGVYAGDKCYYNSTECPHYSFRGVCHRFATPSYSSYYWPDIDAAAKYCSGIYDSYNDICYYNLQAY